MRLPQEKPCLLKNLTVIGLYHEKQLTNFKDSIRFATENGRDWIKIHELKDDLHPERKLARQSLCRALSGSVSRQQLAPGFALGRWKRLLTFPYKIHIFSIV